MDPRILEITQAAETLLLAKPLGSDDGRRFLPMRMFRDLIRPVPMRAKVLNDYQLDVVKHHFTEYVPNRNKPLYTLQSELLIPALAHYLDVGPNAQPYDDTPWMDDPLPVVHQFRNGWRIVDGHHRLIAGCLLDRTVYCATAQARPEYA